ncbi:GNAT family N-acetyltransferase [Sulfuriferula sp. AH1]|uniref:GNAT family N-acetyltransferase n=1 Tax=Sulfuriferula sp. AH1 TaxID=1985873 RepID=UPI000B3BA86E|nr:GNAT family N-acetyltransferase [Sulfuriferula sp. AH1]ARU31121.1 GNAT family N-acetyltransferase [Sulfuriferula sp. AH1]
MSTYAIHKATSVDAAAIASMVQQLLEEIMAVTGGAHFHVDLPAIVERCERFIAEGIYTVLIAVEDTGNAAAGFISLTETHSLYAEGAFGIIPELYVQPAFRSGGAGQLLLDAAKAYGRSRGWQRLEVTTPPLPAFDRTLGFYQANGFDVAGGRKMKVLL